MRKIPNDMENPIDDLFYDLADRTDKPYKDLGMTANNITTLSLLSGLLAAHQLYSGNKILAVILYIISFYYDNMDGNYARKYKMTSKYGEIYDHLADWIKHIVLFCVMIKLNPNKSMIVIPIILFFALLMTVHLGCQEKIYDRDKKKDQPILSLSQSFCPNEKYIHITKYFGTGTLTLIIIIMILIY